MKRTLRQTKENKERELNPQQQADLSKIKNMAKRFEGKSDTELVSELQKAFNKGKSDGSMDENKLNELAGFISPMLNASQRSRLDSLMKKIK